MRPKILVVDDEPACREATLLLLELRGCEVRVAESAEPAMTLCRQFQPDVAIIDWMLRDETDGLALAEALAAERPELPMIIITGYPSAEVVQRIARLKNGRYLSKPVAPNELFEALQDALD